MKKVILVVFVLAICGVLHNSALTQQLDSRYLVTYWRSLTGNQIRAVTAVTVVNQSDSVCNVQVEWFRSAGPHVNFSGPQPLNPGEALQFCSRSVGALITNCPQRGIAAPPLPTDAANTNQGTAIVSSTDSPACRNIAVDARVYQTTGTNTAGDTAISAISSSKIVFVDEGNLGD